MSPRRRLEDHFDLVSRNLLSNIDISAIEQINVALMFLSALHPGPVRFPFKEASLPSPRETGLLTVGVSTLDIQFQNFY